MDSLLSRAQIAWASYAGIDGGFRPGQVSLGVNAQSRICPPGWAGIVVLGDAAIVTVPAPGAERELRRALAASSVSGWPEPPELGGYRYKAAGNRPRTATLICEYTGR